MKHALSFGAVMVAGALALAFDMNTASAGEANVAPTINEEFKDPELDVSRWEATFSGESREVFTAREEVVRAMAIAPGQTVADIGAGTGIYTRLFAREVGEEGKVLAVDIVPKFLAYIDHWAEEESLPQIATILGHDQSPNLPEDSLDLIFTSNTYHHFEYPITMVAEMYKALHSGGAMIVVDYERTPQWAQHVRAAKSNVIAEIESVGFRMTEEVHIGGFRENYFLRFEKP